MRPYEKNLRLLANWYQPEALLAPKRGEEIGVIEAGMDLMS
jgi:hypothetical protein